MYIKLTTCCHLALSWYLLSADGAAINQLSGDLVIEHVVSLYGNVNGNCASSVDLDVVQNVEAIKWIIRKLNDEKFLPVDMSLKVRQTCRAVARARMIGVELANELTDPGYNKTTVGVLGPVYSSQAEALSQLLSALPEKYRLLQIGYAPTAVSLRDRTKYSNFYRTIPADDIQIKVMRLLLEDLDWTYLAAIYDDDAYGRGGVDGLVESTQSGDKDLCFTARIPVNTAMSVADTEQLMESTFRDFLGRAVPVEGFLVFGGTKLSDSVLIAAEKVFSNGTKPPVFLFSEAGALFEGKFLNVSGGSFITSPTRVFIKEFQDYWTSIFTTQGLTKLRTESESNPWLSEAYEKVSGCTLSSNSCSALSAEQVQTHLPPSVFTQYGVQAAMILALVTKQVFIDKCGSTQSGLCDDFINADRQTFIDKLVGLEINFDRDFGNVRLPEFQDPDLEVSFPMGSTEVSVKSNRPVYEVLNHRICSDGQFCFKQVANYSDTFELDTSQIRDYEGETELHWPNIRKAQCPDLHVCTECLKTDVDSILVVPGEMYVVGIAPIHERGATPLLCGHLKRGAVDVVEAMRFSISEAARTFSQKIPSASIGLIIIDSCNDAQVIQEKVLTLLRYGVPGHDPEIRNKIIGFIGAWSSGVSIALSEILTRFGYVQISYASTAPSLSDREVYPFFLRITSSDVAQATTILEITEALGATYIQIVYSASAYGVGGRDLIAARAKDKDICIVNEISVSASTDPTTVVTGLNANPDAKVVILWLGSFDMRWLLTALNDNIEKDQFIFILSEAWGTRDFSRRHPNLAGSITLAVELPVNTKFQDHLKALTPERENEDPWLRDYMEDTFSCYYEWSYDKKSGQQCSGLERLDNGFDYKIDPWVPFVETAIYALLEGANSALQERCHGNASSLCANFRESPAVLVEKIKEVKLDMQKLGNEELVVDSNGDGLPRFNIYSIEKDGLSYTKLGNKEPTGNVQFPYETWRAISGRDAASDCTAEAACSICFSDGTSALPDCEPVSVGVVVATAVLAVLSCVLFAILMFLCNRRGCCLKIENGKPHFTSPYITAVYDPTPRNRPVELEDYDVINDVKLTAGAGERFGPDGREPEPAHAQHRVLDWSEGVMDDSGPENPPECSMSSEEVKTGSDESDYLRSMSRDHVTF